MMTRSNTTSFAGRATAMRRMRRRTSSVSASPMTARLYCRTNGCTSFLIADSLTGNAQCPICGYTSRSH